MGVRVGLLLLLAAAVATVSARPIASANDSASLLAKARGLEETGCELPTTEVLTWLGGLGMGVGFHQADGACHPGKHLDPNEKCTLNCGLGADGRVYKLRTGARASLKCSSNSKLALESLVSFCEPVSRSRYSDHPAACSNAHRTGYPIGIAAWRNYFQHLATHNKAVEALVDHRPESEDDPAPLEGPAINHYTYPGGKVITTLLEDASDVAVFATVLTTTDWMMDNIYWSQKVVSESGQISYNKGSWGARKANGEPGYGATVADVVPFQFNTLKTTFEESSGTEWPLPCSITQSNVLNAGAGAFIKAHIGKTVSLDSEEDRAVFSEFMFRTDNGKSTHWVAKAAGLLPVAVRFYWKDEGQTEPNATIELRPVCSGHWYADSNARLRGYMFWTLPNNAKKNCATFAQMNTYEQWVGDWGSGSSASLSGTY